MSARVPPAPQRARQQIDEALARANTIRLARAKAHHEIRAMPMAEGMRAAAGLIAEHPEHIGGALVSVVMSWPHRAQRPIMERLCEGCGMTSFKLCRDVTDRQAQELIAAVDDHLERWPRKAAA